MLKQRTGSVAHISAHGVVILHMFSTFRLCIQSPAWSTLPVHCLLKVLRCGK